MLPASLPEYGAGVGCGDRSKPLMAATDVADHYIKIGGF